MAAAFLAPPMTRVSITMTSVPSSMMGGAVRRRSTPQQQRRYTPHSSSPPRPSKTISSSGGAYGVIYVGSKYGGPHCRIGDNTLYVIGNQRCFRICCHRNKEAEVQRKSGTGQRGSSTGQNSTSFVGGLLEKVLGTYLKSQLDECGDLDVIVQGSNWELLSGKVRDVQVSATNAIYKGVFLTEVDLTASRVVVKPGRKRLLQKPFLVNAQIRVQEDHLNASLASPLFSRSLKKMFPRKPSTLNVQFEDGNLRFSSSDHLSTGYGQAEFPITLRIDVEKGGEILSVDSVSGTSIQKTFKVGPEVRITEFRVNDSWMQLRGDFLITP
ncbi:unnamed protein product [Sphagnum jensenii]|uniref:Uncharacterized protein n=1 Tax=Sphagnum jensenii TaxID=128206 RepID=A0ABP1B7K1_9BRYO